MWRLASMRGFREPERRDRADGGARPDHPMERIFVPEEAFEAIKATLPMGSVACEPEIIAGLHLTLVEAGPGRQAAALCGKGESYSDLRGSRRKGERSCQCTQTGRPSARKVCRPSATPTASSPR
jgi:hypothetical protein